MRLLKIFVYLAWLLTAEQVLAQLPTNNIAPLHVTITTDTNGVLIAQTNFFAANSNLLNGSVAAVVGGGAGASNVLAGSGITQTPGGGNVTTAVDGTVIRTTGGNQTFIQIPAFQNGMSITGITAIYDNSTSNFNGDASLSFQTKNSFGSGFGVSLAFVGTNALNPITGSAAQAVLGTNPDGSTNYLYDREAATLLMTPWNAQAGNGTSALFPGAAQLVCNPKYGFVLASASGSAGNQAWVAGWSNGVTDFPFWSGVTNRNQPNFPNYKSNMKIDNVHGGGLGILNIGSFFGYGGTMGTNDATATHGYTVGLDSTAGSGGANWDIQSTIAGDPHGGGHLSFIERNATVPAGYFESGGTDNLRLQYGLRADNGVITNAFTSGSYATITGNAKINADGSATFGGSIPTASISATGASAVASLTTLGNVQYGTANSPSVNITTSNIDASTASNFGKVLSANTPFLVQNLADGQTIDVAVTNTTGNFLTTWSGVTGAGGSLPTQTLGAHSDWYRIKRMGSATNISIVTQGY